ncbi:hypothetical protein LCGC14_1372160 [marine sediment metagenome]|uniref:Uncharacterized protein n=1 Tax=marine sediment metagenome TaxID=412755 RepID=A0A0F9K543_9ZZZZ
MVMEAITGGLLGGIGVPSKVVPATQVPFKTTLVPTDGDLGAGEPAAMIAILAAVVAGADVLLWTMTVPAQQQIRWGFGSPATPMNQGYMWFGIMLAATGFDQGTVLLSHENYSRHQSVVVDEFNDGLTHTAVSTTLITARDLNKKTLKPLPERLDLPVVGQDSRLVIDYTAIVLVAEDTGGFDIPATVYD